MRMASFPCAESAKEISPGSPESARATPGPNRLNPSLSRAVRRAKRVSSFITNGPNRFDHPSRKTAPFPAKHSPDIPFSTHNEQTPRNPVQRKWEKRRKGGREVRITGSFSSPETRTSLNEKLPNEPISISDFTLSLSHLCRFAIIQIQKTNPFYKRPLAFGLFRMPGELLIFDQIRPNPTKSGSK